MKQATEIVHWPGKDTPACDEHAQKLRALGNFMGFAVSCTPCWTEEACTNCENESRALAGEREPESGPAHSVLPSSALPATKEPKP